MVGVTFNDKIDEYTEKNNGVGPSDTRKAVMLLASAGEIALERLTFGKAIKGESATVEGLKKLLDSAPTSARKTLAKELGKKAGVLALDATEEGAQEGYQYISNYLTSEYGTANDKGFNIQEMKKNIAGGFGAGGVTGVGGQVRSAGETVSKVKEAKVEETLRPEYKAEERKQNVQTAMKASKTVTKENLEAMDKAILKAEAEGDTTVVKRLTELRNKAVNSLVAEKEIDDKDLPVLGNEEATVDYINDLLTGVKDVKSEVVRKNVEKIAEKNGVGKDIVESIFKDFEAVERDVTVGSGGYRTYERQLKQLSKEPKANAREIGVVTNKLNRLLTSQENKISAIMSAINKATEKIRAGTMVDDYIDVPSVKTQSGKPYRIYINKTGQSYDEIVHPATRQLLVASEGTVNNIREILGNMAESEVEVVDNVKTEVKPQQTTDEKEKPISFSYVNHSGGALGSDTAWGEVGSRFGVKTNHYYTDKTPNGNVKITKEQLTEGIEYAKRAAKALGRTWSNKPYVQGLLARNWQQVKNADAVFAIGNISDNTVDGGTGYAVEMAKEVKKPIYVFNQKDNKWYKFNYDTNNFIRTTTPRLTPNFAGIGTRKLSNAGKAAIEEVYNITFKNNSSSNTELGLSPTEEVGVKTEEKITFNKLKQMANEATKAGDKDKAKTYEKLLKAAVKVLKDEAVKKVEGLSGRVVAKARDIFDTEMYGKVNKKLGKALQETKQIVSNGMQRVKTEYVANETVKELLATEAGRDRVLEGMTKAILDFTATEVNGLQFIQDRDVTGLLGLSNENYVGGVALKIQREYGKGFRVIAAGLGADIRRAMGIGVSEELPAREQAELEATLGAMAIEVMVANGTVEKTEIPKEQVEEMFKAVGQYDEKTVYDRIETVRIGKNAENNVKNASKLKDVLKKYETEFVDNTKDVRTSKITAKEFKTRRREDVGDIPKEQQKVLLRESNVAYEFNEEIVDGLVALDDAGVLEEILGAESEIGKRPDTAEKVKSANNQIKESIRKLREGYEGLKGREFFFNYFFSSNGRFFIDSNTLNPQNDKLHRFAMNRVGDTVVVDNEETRNLFKLAVVQALDGTKGDVDSEGFKELGKIDKQSLADSVKDFDGILKSKNVQEAVQAAKNKDWTNAKLVQLLKNADHASHALMALIELGKYNENSFETNMTLEADAVTSGFILSLMTTPVMSMDKVKFWLAKGGVWLGGTDKESFGEYIGQEGVNDTYETGAKEVGKYISKEVSEAGKWLIPELVDNKGNATKDGRKFMKDPLMVFNYGAGNRSIEANLGYIYADKAFDMINDGKNIEKDVKALLDAAIVELEKQIETASEKEVKQIQYKVKQLKMAKALSWNDIQGLVKNTAVVKDRKLSRLHEAIKVAVGETYGKATTKYLNTEYAELVAVRKAVNKVYEIAGERFAKKYNEAYQNGATKAELAKIVKEAQDNGFFPSMTTANTEGTSDKASILASGKMAGERKLQYGKIDGKAVKVSPIYKVWAKAPTSAGVIFTHWTDGSIMAKTKKGLGIHDAKMLGLGYAYEAIRDYQKASWDLTVNGVSPIEQALEMASKLNDDKLEDAVNILKQAKEIVDANKAEMIASGASVEHMSLPGSKIEIEGEGTVLGNEPDYIDEWLSAEAKRNLGPTLGVNFNGSTRVADVKFLKIEDVEVKNGGEEIIVHTESGQYRFIGGKNKSEKSRKGTYVVTSQIQGLYQMLGVYRNEMNDSMVDTGRLMEGALESTEGMVDLFDKIGTESAEDSRVHQAHLRGLLQMVNTDFLPKMRVYLASNAERNKGQLSVAAKKISLAISKGPRTDSEMSGQEVYVHEVIHAFTAYAMMSKDIEAKRVLAQIQRIQDTAKKQISKEELPEGKWEYVFESENNLAEFIAYSMTNEKFMKLLDSKYVKEKEAETLLDRLVELVRKVLDIVTFRNRDVKDGETLQDAMMVLTFNLMEYNNRAVKKIEEKNSLLQYMGSILDKADNTVASAIGKVLVKASKEGVPVEQAPVNASRLELAKWYVKYIPQLLLRDDMKPYRSMILSAFFMKPEGWLQNVLRDIGTPDALERIIEKLGMMSDMIDQGARSMEGTVRKAIVEAFDRKLTDTEKETLTEMVVDVDLQSIYSEYSVEELAEIIDNDGRLDSEIAKVKKQLNGEYGNWYDQQAYGLGKYMVTGYAGIAQNLNAKNIADGVLLDGMIDANEDTVKAIDKLATLYAVKLSKRGSRSSMAKMLRSDSKGVKFVVEMHERFVEESKEKLFGSQRQMIKGYSKEIFDDTISIIVKPLADRVSMEEQGYELVKPLDKVDGDLTSVPMGLYKTKSFTASSYYRSATRLTNMVKRGTSVTDLAFMNKDNQIAELERAKYSNKKLNRKRLAVAKAMKDGVYKSEEDSHISPVINSAGKVVDYRYMMSKAEKRELLGQDTRIDNVIARSHGSVIDKAETKKHNDEVLKVILKDMEDNYVEGSLLGNNNMEYIKIEKNSTNEMVNEIYQLLPDNMKEHIKNSKFGYIAVRRDMLLNYFGFRHASITNLRIGGIRLSNGQIKAVIKMAEMLWQEFVKIAKVNIIIRIPSVLIGNIISNVMYTVVSGGNVVKVIRLQVENARWLREYLNVSEELRNAKLLKMESRIKGLEKKLRDNPVHEIMEAGMYQAIIEDIGKADFESSNRVSRWFDKKMSGLPTFVRDGVNWLYLTEKTGYFKLMTQATQYSDFVARATQNQLMKERGISKERRMQVILDAFVNYNKPATAIEEWFNQMGLMMFTKYAKRVQRAIAQQGKEHPIRALLYILAQEWMGVGIDDIYDQSVVSRSWNSIGISPLDHIWNVVTPATADMIGGKY
jgi:hypothetical protein